MTHYLVICNCYHQKVLSHACFVEYRQVVYVAEKAGLKPTPTYKEYLVIKDDLANCEEFNFIFKQV